MNFLGIKIFDDGHSARLKQAERFSRTMEVANNIANLNPSALKDLILALLRPLQSEHILAVAERGDHQAPPEIEGASFFFPDRGLFSYSEHYIRDAPRIELNFARDPILPTPWKRNGFVKALATIGTGKAQGVWEQSSNHVVSLWLPWGIGFVSGGNHSIASGILSGEDIPIVVSEVYDFSSILELVECDGAAYRSKQTGEVLAQVGDSRRAAVFEIGRLMLQHGVALVV